jgi:hypothetical protein
LHAVKPYIRAGAAARGLPYSGFKGGLDDAALESRFMVMLRRFEMRKYPTDERFHEEVMEALLSLAAEGLIYDTGRRKWSERTRSYQVVWAAVPPRNEQN